MEYVQCDQISAGKTIKVGNILIVGTKENVPSHPKGPKDYARFYTEKRVRIIDK